MSYKKIIHIVAWSFVFILFCGLFLFIALPQIVESEIKKRVPQDFAAIDFQIQTIGFSNSSIAHIKIADGLNVDSARAEYTIKGLKTFVLDKILISGLTIKINIDENHKLKIQGLTLSGSNSNDGQSNPSKFLPYLPKKVVLKNSSAVINFNGKSYTIPFESLLSIPADKDEMILQSKFFPFGEEIRASTIVNLQTMTVQSVRINAESFDLEHINPIISQFMGDVSFAGPTQFEFSSESIKTKWKAQISAIDFSSPFAVSIKDVDVSARVDDQHIFLNGSLIANHPFTPAIPLTFESNTQIKDTFPTILKLKSELKEKFEVSSNDGVMTINGGKLNFDYNGTLNKGQGKLVINTNQGKLAYRDQSLGFQKMHFNSDSRIDLTKKDQLISSTVALRMNEIKTVSTMGEASFPLATTSGRFFMGKDGNPKVKLTIKTEEGKIKSKKFNTSVSGIQIKMPLSYPYDNKQKSGQYEISNISYNNQYHIGVSGKIFQTGQKQIDVEGDVNFKPISQIKTRFNSNIDFSEGFSLNGSFNTNTFNLSYQDIEKVIPNKVKSAEVDITSTAKGKINFSHNQSILELELDVSDGTLKLPDLNLSATGINTRIKFQDLLNGESVPGQILTIDSIEMNQIKMSDAKIRFTIEDKDTYLVENIRLNWCEGLVSSESIRFKSGKNQYTVTLFCDRLDLAHLLKQMGAFSAEGSGTLNGRIPVIYSDGNIAFDNGFLFSTPGSGGNVVIENTDRITAGIPMDSPQFSQLDLAQEALKDFDYNWAKLVFNTSEDTLFVNMELDGKPSKPLPFVFKKEFGGFARVDASSPGSNFQGIKLDVNLKLPFNDVIKFGNKLKSLFK